LNALVGRLSWGVTLSNSTSTRELSQVVPRNILSWLKRDGRKFACAFVTAMMAICQAGVKGDTQFSNSLFAVVTASALEFEFVVVVVVVVENKIVMMVEVEDVDRLVSVCVRFGVERKISVEYSLL
jgi:hypothetical protein